MGKKPKVIVLRTAGTNCDEETAFAFKECGAQVSSVHINRIVEGKVRLSDFHILAIPGGFTYGDDIASGRILANELRLRLGENIRQFIKEGKLIIGICNGFQVLVKTGFLPGNFKNLKNNKSDSSPVSKVTLVSNDSGKFEDRWTHVKIGGNSPWIQGLEDIVCYPVAHAEGKLIPENQDVLNRLIKNKQIAFRYCAVDGKMGKYPINPNGSVYDIAGITDTSGRILGMMPHPERHFLFTQHPNWTRFQKKSKLGDGARIFQNGVNYVRKIIL
jgi:phosphoribosylformylglycinamidine synthase subunit PurQ / glutaminase